MTGLNKVILIGTVGKEPFTQYVKKGFAKTSFPLATDETVSLDNGQKTVLTEWHSVAVYGKLSEYASQYVHKGDVIWTEGKLVSFISTSENGFRYKTTEILADRLQIITRSKANAQTPVEEEEGDDGKIGSAIPGFDIDNLNFKSGGDELPF